MLGCKPNPVNLVGGVVVRVGGATPLMWVVVVTATVGGITSLVGIAKSGPFAAVAETTNNNTRPIAYICNRCLTESLKSEYTIPQILGLVGPL